MTENIDRRTALSVTEFVERYLIGNMPVIVTDAMERWSLFRSPEELGQRFGGDLVQVYNDLFDLTKVTTLRAYLDECFGKNDVPPATGPLPYVRWYTKMKDVDFVWADEAFKRFAAEWSMPYFLPTSDYLLPSSSPGTQVSPTTHLFPAKGLFISGRGAGTRLHCDPWASDAVLCQIFGKKELTFYEPENSVASAGEPRRRRSVTVLQPGEIAFIPRWWPHSALSLTDSISLTWNFVHVSTWKWFFQHLASPDAAVELPVLRFFANLPSNP